MWCLGVSVELDPLIDTAYTPSDPVIKLIGTYHLLGVGNLKMFTQNMLNLDLVESVV